MNWDRVGTMKKIDDAGASAMAKLRGQRDAGKGVGIQDRWKMAQGKDDRWEQSSKNKNENQEDQVEPGPSKIHYSRVAPVKPPARTSAGSNPPPPIRRNNSSSASNNSIPSRVNVNNTNQKDYIEFSKFTQQDKESFFELLDQFFDDKLNSAATDPPPIYSPPNQAEAPKPPSRTIPTSSSTPSSNPAQARGAAPTIAPRTSTSTPTPTPASTSTSTSTSTSASSNFPVLTASSSSIENPCSALSAATFFIYPESFPEWENQWYTSTTDRQPPNLKNRNDILWRCSTSYIGNSNTMIGSIFFSDLSILIYNISWDSKKSKNYDIGLEYKEIPKALSFEILKESSEIYGESIAKFAEESERNGRPIGDGECWTLAKEAIENVNKDLENQGRNDLKALESIGRTHGHLIFHGIGNRIKESQLGRWRGGDRKREDWGGVRRGDIVEWYRTTCAEVGARNGSWSVLGDPDHTAVIITDSPVPDRLGEDLDTENQPDLKPYELESITVIEQSVGQVPTRKSYDLNAFTEGKMWIYRPCGRDAYIGGEVKPEFPSRLFGIERLA